VFLHKKRKKGTIRTERRFSLDWMEMNQLVTNSNSNFICVRSRYEHLYTNLDKTTGDKTVINS
jgi:hypothetical protein